MYKPKTIDVALSLALMQKEILKSSTRRFSPRAREYNRSAIKFANSVETPSSSVADILPTTEKLATSTNAKPKWDSKLSTLQAQIRKMDLCMNCGENGEEVTLVLPKYLCISWKSFWMPSGWMTKRMMTTLASIVMRS